MTLHANLKRKAEKAVSSTHFFVACDDSDADYPRKSSTLERLSISLSSVVQPRFADSAAFVVALQLPL
jgi:hypothetical protein